ncbi:Uncharacterised protein [Burkholderia pseudomallei]|nr:Uncharacterised protein [Burkholderia pseudomallei]CAK0218535.1 Uncharacterised protein [Burkholderia pseudomallei]VCG40427.1 Uncharacterised protein [Burkholderia pseudomallei]
MLAREPEEHAARARVVVRRALAAQVGQKQRRARGVRALGERGQRVDGDVVRLREPVEARRGRQDHAHLMPALGQAMAERVHGVAGIRREAVVAGKQHARRAERQEPAARVRDAHADRARRVVARAARDRDGAGHAPFAPQRVAQLRGRGAAFDEARHLLARQLGRGEHPLGPVAPADVEPQRAGCVRHVGHEFAGQPPRDVILRQQHLVRGAEHRGLVLREPQQLRRGEARHRHVAGDRARFGHERLELDAFGRGARVVPEDRGAQHLPRAVDERRAVHLAGQADPAQRGEAARMHGAHGGDRVERRVPPRLRALLGPVRMGALDGERRAAGGERRGIGVGQDRLDFGCAEIDAEIGHGWRLRCE